MEIEENRRVGRRQFSAEFKAETVRLVMSGERGQSAVARNLGNWTVDAAQVVQCRSQKGKQLV